jgi:hypothetical protein
MGRRFLKRLEQSVRGFIGQHMDLIYDIDLVTSLIGSIVNPLAEATDVLNTPVTGSINLNYIQSSTLGYCLAHRASITWFPLAIGKAVHCFSQDAAGAGLTRSSRTTKKVSMRYTTTIEGIE